MHGQHFAEQDGRKQGFLGCAAMDKALILKDVLYVQTFGQMHNKAQDLVERSQKKQQTTSYQCCPCSWSREFLKETRTLLGKGLIITNSLIMRQPIYST